MGKKTKEKIFGGNITISSLDMWNLRFLRCVNRNVKFGAQWWKTSDIRFVGGDWEQYFLSFLLFILFEAGFCYSVQVALDSPSSAFSMLWLRCVPTHPAGIYCMLCFSPFSFLEIFKSDHLFIAPKDLFFDETQKLSVREVSWRYVLWHPTFSQ